MRDAPSWTSGRSWRRCSYWTGPSCTTWTQWQRLENLKKRPRKKGIGLSCKAKILQEKQRSLQKRYCNAKRILFTVTHNCKGGGSNAVSVRQKRGRVRLALRVEIEA